MQKRKNSGPVTTVTVFVCLCIHGEYEERYVSSDTINMIRKNKLLKDMLYCYYPDVFQKEAFFACDVINFLLFVILHATSDLCYFSKICKAIWFVYG